jgi:antitoxin ParD1/3/4
LTPEIESIIREKVASGRYANASEVVRDALRLLDEVEQRSLALHDALAQADEQTARGEVVEWTPQLHADILRRAAEAMKAGRQPKADVCP